MCVILHRPANAVIDSADIESAFLSNKDGHGFAYVSDGRVHYSKRKPGPVEAILKDCRRVPDLDLVIHLRYATHGKISQAMAHPFPVTSQETHGRDIVLFHNGTVAASDLAEKGESDTAALVRAFLAPLLSVNPDLIHDAGFIHVLGEYIGWSRLVFVSNNPDPDLQIVKVNAHKGCYRGDIWASNDSYFDTKSRYDSLWGLKRRNTSKPAKQSARVFDYTETGDAWDRHLIAQAQTGGNPLDSWDEGGAYVESSFDNLSLIDCLRLDYSELFDLASTRPDLAAELLDDLKNY